MVSLTAPVLRVLREFPRSPDDPVCPLAETERTRPLSLYYYRSP